MSDRSLKSFWTYRYTTCYCYVTADYRTVRVSVVLDVVLYDFIV